MSSEIIIKIRQLEHARGLPLPSYQSEQAAAMDIYAACQEPVVISPGKVILVPTGIAIALPEGYEIQIRPRSGLAVKQIIVIPNSPATIDADYRGELMVPLLNLGDFELQRGRRIAQMLVAPVPRMRWELVEELPPSKRGPRGFGHTGT